MADRMTPGELQEILDLAFADGDEVMAIQLASQRRVYTMCCTYNYTSYADEPKDPYNPPPQPQPKPKPKK